MHFIDDEHFDVTTVSSTLIPQTLAYLAMHQCYAEHQVTGSKLSEQEAGKIVVERCLKYGHWGICENLNLTLSSGGFPHSVINQVRTHRTGITFDVQSMRYTSKRFVDWYRAGANLQELEALMYLRPTGFYANREGVKTQYSDLDRQRDMQAVYEAVRAYCVALQTGQSPEQAADILPRGYRQHFMTTANLRTWLHLLAVRYKADVQPECQTWAKLVLAELMDFTPEIMTWFCETHLGKIRLMP